MAHTVVTVTATFIISVGILVPILQMRKWKPKEGNLLVLDFDSKAQMW